MKQWTKRNAILIAALGMTLLSNSQSLTKKVMEQKNLDREQNEVLNAVLAMTEAFHQKDLKRVMASYESNAVITFEPGRPVSDTNDIRTGFNGFFELNPKFTYSGHEVFVNRDLAIHFAPWSMTGKSPDGKEIRQDGLSVAVLRKQPDGKWLMVFDNPFGAHLLDKK